MKQAAAESHRKVPPTPPASEKVAPLEGLRAIAVGLVIVAHTVGSDVRLGSTLIRGDIFTWWAPGPAGVRLFFVLSGFLITRILLRARAKHHDRAFILRAFYVRRALRIFPAASVVVLVACLVGIPVMRAQWAWFAGYAINIWMAKTATLLVPSSGGHFWSLAIEEQFYLFWPLVLLWIPRRALALTLSAMVVLAICTRLTLLLADQPIAAYVLMPARLDALAAGGLLAWCVEEGKSLPPWLSIFGTLLVAAGATLHSRAWGNSAMETGMVLLSLVVVNAVRNLRERDAGYRMLGHPVPVYLGGISYGLYLWHGLVPPLIQSAAEATGRDWFLPSQGGWLRFGYVSAVTTVIASVSWYTLERPLNQMKLLFPYAR